MKIKNFCYTFLLLLVLVPLSTANKVYAENYYEENFNQRNENDWQYFNDTNSVFFNSGTLTVSHSASDIYSTYIRSKSPIIPNSNNYSIATRFRFPSTTPAGVGIVFGESNPDFPVDFSDPVESRIFTIWKDSNGPFLGLVGTVNDGTFVNLGNYSDTNFHILTLTQVSQQYDVLIDGTFITSFNGTRQIKNVWFGNPGPAINPQAWTSVELDYIQVTVNNILNDYNLYPQSSVSYPLDRTINIPVLLTDADEPVENATVSAEILEGDLSLLEETVSTDQSGKAVFSFDPKSTGYAKIKFSYSDSETVSEFEVYRPPVVIVPGHTASFNSKELFLNIDDGSNWGWFTDISKDSWDKIINLLEESGYVEGVDFKVAFYDWRKSLSEGYNIPRDNFLIPAIDELLANKPENTKINILAHSFGGLVTRSLVEHNGLYANKINKIMTFGTPHAGASGAYYIYEGGIPAPAGDVVYRSAMGVMTRAIQYFQNYSDKVTTIRSEVPSVKNLLPTYGPYISKNDIFLNLGSMFAQNDILNVELFENNYIDKVNDNNIDYTNVLSDSKFGISDILTTNYHGPIGWEDGRPTGEFYQELGDGTVLFDENNIYGYTSKVDSNHGDIPDASYELVKDELNISQNADSDLESPTNAVYILLLSPATVEVYDSENNLVETEIINLPNNKFIYVLNSLDPGEYTLNVIGTGKGDYTLFVNFADEDSYQEFEFEGETKKDQVDVYPLIINDDAKMPVLKETKITYNPGLVKIVWFETWNKFSVKLPKLPGSGVKFIRLNGIDMPIKDWKLNKNGIKADVYVSVWDVLKATNWHKGKVNFPVEVGVNDTTFYDDVSLNITNKMLNL